MDKVEIGAAGQTEVDMILRNHPRHHNPWDFFTRDMGRICPSVWYNHKTKTFKKNQRKGL